jgi:hypothetical protein
LLQSPRRARHQIIWGERRGQVFTRNDAIVTNVKVQRVAPVDQHKDGLQQVIAILTPTCDVQKQIKFGGG